MVLLSNFFAFFIGSLVGWPFPEKLYNETVMSDSRLTSYDNLTPSFFFEKNDAPQQWETPWDVGHYSVQPMGRAFSLTLEGTQAFLATCPNICDGMRQQCFNCFTRAPSSKNAEKCAQDSAEDAAKVAAIGLMMLEIHDGHMVNVSADGGVISFLIDDSQFNVTFPNTDDWNRIKYFARAVIDFQKTKDCKSAKGVSKVIKDFCLSIQDPLCYSEIYDGGIAEVLHNLKEQSIQSLIAYLDPNHRPDHKTIDYNKIAWCITIGVVALCAVGGSIVMSIKCRKRQQRRQTLLAAGEDQSGHSLTLTH